MGVPFGLEHQKAAAMWIERQAQNLKASACKYCGEQTVQGKCGNCGASTTPTSET